MKIIPLVMGVVVIAIHYVPEDALVGFAVLFWTCAITFGAVVWALGEDR